MRKKISVSVKLGNLDSKNPRYHCPTGLAASTDSGARDLSMTRITHQMGFQHPQILIQPARHFCKDIDRIGQLLID
jgi:hypothetical protein